MKTRYLAASVAMILVAVHAGSRNPTAHRGESEWTDIFPTVSLQGWTRVGIPPNHPLSPSSQWTVDAANHTLICSGDQGHEWLRYDRELGDFVLHVEWRLAKVEGAKNYNSGVFVRNSADGRIWYQAQVGTTSAGYLFGDNPVDSSLQRFDLHSSLTGNHVNDAGQWNTYDIRCQGPVITLTVNGAKTSEFDQCHNLKGYLGLEAEGSRIEFRNLRVSTLQ